MSMAKNVYVYFVQEVTHYGKKGHVKIGVARNVESRLESLQTGNWRRLVVRAVIGPLSKSQAYDMENKFHKVFRKERLLGEWFNKSIMRHNRAWNLIGTEQAMHGGSEFDVDEAVERDDWHDTNEPDGVLNHMNDIVKH